MFRFRSLRQTPLCGGVATGIYNKGRKSQGHFQMSAGGRELLYRGSEISLEYSKKKKRKKKIIMVLFFSPAMTDLVSGETQGTSDKEQSKRS